MWKKRSGAFFRLVKCTTKRCPGVVTSLREGGDELLTFFTFPKGQWKTLRTTNTIERLHAEFRRPCKDARLVAKRRCGAGLALQPRGQRTDQVAQDRRLAEN